MKMGLYYLSTLTNNKVQELFELVLITKFEIKKMHENVTCS
jgi:hypothetical protein